MPGEGRRGHGEKGLHRNPVFCRCLYLRAEQLQAAGSREEEGFVLPLSLQPGPEVPLKSQPS